MDGLYNCASVSENKPLRAAANPEATLREAAQSWLDARDPKTARVRYLKPRTLKSYKLELEALVRFFGDTRLCDIGIDDIRQYQRTRVSGERPFKSSRCPHHVNHEIVKLQKILTRADLWHLIADDFEPLEVPFHEPRRVMTRNEERHFFEVASSSPDFILIYAYCLLSASTSASGAELRGLRLIDIDLVGRTLQVNAESAKNPARIRTIPLVDDALWAANSLVIRARSLGAKDPYEYLFPIKKGNSPHNPKEHMSDNGLQKQFHALRTAAGMPWLTMHVFRYQAITKLAEGSVDRVTAKRISGHVTDDMWDKYSQVRNESIREAMTQAFERATLPSTDQLAKLRPRVVLSPGIEDVAQPRRLKERVAPESISPETPSPGAQRSAALSCTSWTGGYQFPFRSAG